MQHAPHENDAAAFGARLLHHVDLFVYILSIWQPTCLATQPRVSIEMSFVKLDNLNDFIQPGSTCIKPSVEKKIGVVAKVGDINLSDCLACSGCITSAETVLVQQQNHEELFRVINESKSNKVSASTVPH